MRNYALWFSVILLALSLTGCGTESGKPASVPQLDAAKAELLAATQRVVEFKVEPAEQSARVGQMVQFALKVKNKSTQPIEGIKFYAGGPWIYLSDRTVKPSGQVEDGFLQTTIKSDATIAPGQTTTFTVTGVVSDLIQIKTDGHEFTFTPTVTLDEKKIVGADLLRVKVYVLPAK
ncbi:MAG: methane monooxygenase/ammonia monooxygenase subunit B [Chitinophagales bacterium]